MLTVSLIGLSANAVASINHTRVQSAPTVGTIQAVQNNGFTVRINNQDYFVTSATQIRYSSVSRQSLPTSALKPGMLVQFSVLGGSQKNSLSTIIILPK